MTCKKPGGESAVAESYCTKLKCLSNSLLINELVVEATGVELITMLTARKLLIPGSAPTAKKVQLPNPLYVYCTKMLFALDVKLPTNGVLGSAPDQDRQVP